MKFKKNKIDDNENVVEAQETEASETKTSETEASENDTSEGDDDISELISKNASSEEDEQDKAIRKREKKELKKQTKKEKKRRKSEDVNVVRELLNLVVYLGIVIILCFLIITFIGQRTTVHGESMEPTLQSGNNLWIDKISYEFRDPKRFDIIVFPYQGSDVYYIKRVIGLPGETVQIDANGYIYINGSVLDESYGLEPIQPHTIGIAGNPITLGEDEYFVMGDNRNDSRDSRMPDVGNIKKEDIIGRAVFRLSPLNEFGILK